jgi:serine/threonine protein kinase
MAQDEMSARLLAEWEAAIDGFERAWQLGERPSIRAFCSIEGPHAVSLLKELVLVDCEHRLRVGEPRGLSDYLRELPELGNDQDLIFNLLKYESRSVQSAPISSKPEAVPPAGRHEQPQPANAKAANADGTLADGGSTARPWHANTILPPHSVSGDRGQSANSTSPQPPTRVTTDFTHELGQFRLLEMIGQGSFGSVYRAMDMKLGRLVAVKLPRREVLTTAAERERFFREAKLAAGLDHPNIVRVYDVGGTNDGPFIVSAFVDGRTLADEIASRRFEFEESARIVLAIADALQYAHDRSLIHRDVKSSNIMLDVNGTPFLMDFGVAKRDGEAVLTIAGQMVGTPAYMSPEQAAGGGALVDRRSDVYSLGVVLFELLTGERPFRGSVQTILHQIFYTETQSPRSLDPDIPRDLAMICLKCLRKLPGDRYRTAKDLHEDLSKFLRGEPVRITAISPFVIGWRRARKWPKTASALAVVLILAGSLPFVLTQAAKRVENAERQTEENIRLANEAKADAEQSKDAGREDLDKSFILKGNTILESADPSSALPWFAAPLERSPNSLRQIANRVRLVTTLRNVPEPVGLWQVDGSIVNVAHSPTEPLLAIATSRQFILHDLREPKILGQILLNATVMNQCVFTPDGKRLAATSYDGKLRIWLMSDLRHPPMELAQGELARSIAFHPTGRLLASASDQRGVQIWDLAKGTLQATALSPPAIVFCVAFDPGGSLLAMSGRDGLVQLSSIAIGRSRTAPVIHKSPVKCVLFTSDGQSLISAGDDGVVRVWDVATGLQKKWEFPAGSPVECIALHKNGNLLAAGCDDGNVGVWNLKDGRKTHSEIRHEKKVVHVAFTANGRGLLTTSEDGTARVWDLLSGGPASPPVFHRATVSWAEVTDDGKQIMTAGNDRLIRTWQFNAPFTAEVRSHRAGPIASARLSPDERWLFLTRADGPAELCDLSRQKLVLTDVGKALAPRNGAFTPDSHALVTISNRRQLDITDLSSPDKSLEMHTNIDPSDDVAISPNGNLLVTSGSDGIARVRSMSGTAISWNLPHGPGLNRAFFNCDGRKI